MREFVDSCHKYGLKVGMYISPWDIHSPYWGTDDYNDYFANQLTELMTNYGEIHEVWWDGAGSRDAVYDWDKWESIVRNKQPNAAIFGSMGAAGHIDLRWAGNENGYAGRTHYASVDIQNIVDEIRSALNEGQIGAASYVPSEVDVSIRPGWFYHADQDKKVKSVARINKIWFESIGRNAMMLLSFPPDRRGLVCDKDAENAIASHKCISRMLERNYADDAKISICGDGRMLEVVDEADGEGITVFDGRSIDIVLPRAEKVNVFSIGELIEAGERITEFKLEAVEDGKARTLFEGTSVGFRKAFTFEEGEYKHLRFSVTGCLASPLLVRIGLYYFEDVDDDAVIKRGDNIVKSVKMSENGLRADVSFGGIYPFDRVEFSLDRRSACKVYVFSGQAYELVYEGEFIGRRGIDFETPVTHSYQIRIEAESTKITDVVVKWR